MSATLSSLSAASEKFVNDFSIWVEDYLQQQVIKKNFVELLFESKSYSLKSGGKRFRPFLVYLVSQLWSVPIEQIKNYCLAVEMVHTYSLIHDDLPCMDNDDFRRGQPTNHKKFGEDIALLAGDALLTEAFYLISHDHHLTADCKMSLVALLSEKIGSFGMVGGQVLDMKAVSSASEIENQLKKIEQIHLMKTGYLIQAAAVGGAVLAQVHSQALQFVSDFSLQLGLAFQIKDDLLDVHDHEQDFKSYVSVLGVEQTQHALFKTSTAAIESLIHLKSEKNINLQAIELLFLLVEYNQIRTS